MFYKNLEYRLDPGSIDENGYIIVSAVVVEGVIERELERFEEKTMTATPKWHADAKQSVEKQAKAYIKGLIKAAALESLAILEETSEA
jgi:predicted HAD superfamily phosphohydrolase